MGSSGIERIRERVQRQQLDMSAHATEEMAEDGLDIEDVEKAILNGHVSRVEREDPRGTKYVVEGIGADGVTPVGSVGRFTSTGRYLVITVYMITAREE